MVARPRVLPHASSFESLQEKSVMCIGKAGALGLTSFIALIAGCASTPSVGPTAAPEALRPPANQVLALEARATGVQIYECTASRDQPGRYEWTFKAPEADLYDETGRKVGKHYAGPTWEALDGSKVVGEVKARDDGPDPNAIPWLLLAAKSTSGTGVLTQIKSVQRLRTVDGKAPSSPCGPANLQQVARVPYKAAYYFYAAKS
jgi:uncharacterized protein DUF3455